MLRGGRRLRRRSARSGRARAYTARSDKDDGRPRLRVALSLQSEPRKPD